MIVVTGAAGFIGSCLVRKLNDMGITDIVLVDDFNKPSKQQNLADKSFREKIPREVFFEWLRKNGQHVEYVIHIGARTDTAEMDSRVFDHLNLGYSKSVWGLCTEFNIPLIYASSAATYGMGELGYDDDHAKIPFLKPLNPYGESKNEFDKWVLQQGIQPPAWTGLKFFNVYGPNEYHKGRMASVIFHAFRQVNESGRVRLFRSHRPDYEDGRQLRDFIYVKDVVEVIWFLLNNSHGCGIFNLGTGKARTFLDLASACFAALKKDVNISFIDTPADIREKYQYFTEARMDKLREAGYLAPFCSLESGIEEYIGEYLSGQKYY